MTVGEKIRFYRKMKGMSQSDLAKVVSIPVGTLQKWEINKRNPKVKSLKLIAEALDVPVGKLAPMEILPEQFIIDDVKEFLEASVVKEILLTIISAYGEDFILKCLESTKSDYGRKN